MKRTEIKEALQMQELDKEINVKGWVRNKRGSKNVAFIALNDGSTINNLQLVIDLNVIPEESLALMHTGASVSAIGNLVKSAGSGQNVEMNVTSIELIGAADPEKYPLQPKKHSLEFLREIAHLRFRTNTFSAIMRLRHAMVGILSLFRRERIPGVPVASSTKEASIISTLLSSQHQTAKALARCFRLQH